MYLAISNTTNYYRTQLLWNIKGQIQKSKIKKVLKNKEALPRLGINEESNSFFTFKDHKENLQNNPTVRLVDPAKNKLKGLVKLF